MDFMVSYVCGLAFCLSIFGLVISIGLLTHPVFRRESRIAATACLVFSIIYLGEYYFVHHAAPQIHVQSTTGEKPPSHA